MRERPFAPVAAPTWALRVVIAVLLTVCAVMAAAAPAWARGPRTFYVSLSGRDSASGRSPGHAWRTVMRVDRAHLRPGDRVLFCGRETFSDQTLMPGLGFGVSGARGRPVVFGSYGAGRATLTKGIWISSGPRVPHGPRYLTFENLALGPVRGFQGVGSHITLRGLDIENLLPPVAAQETGIQTVGSHWVIVHNTIWHTGDSGMLLGADSVSGGPPSGRFYTVAHNSIVDTGMDAAISWPTHGIYLKVARARVVRNRIIGFHVDGVSVRYQDADISHNTIAYGEIGIAWYQYGTGAGHSRFVGNRISHMSEAGIFVCGVKESCRRPTERFAIVNNQISDVTGTLLNLQPSTGGYLL